MDIGRRPIAQAVADQVVFRLCGHEVDIAPHAVVVFGQHAGVAAILVEIPGDQDVRAVPGRAISPLVAPAEGRHNAGQVSVGPLLVLKVVHPLLVGRGVVEVVHRLFGRQMGVAGPAVLLAVRAVGRVAVDEIAAIRAERQELDLVQQVVRALERTGVLKRGVDDPAAEVFERGLARKTADFDVAESEIGESRFPDFVAFSIENVDAGLERTAVNVFGNAAGIEQSLGIEALAIAHDDAGSGRAGNLQLCPAGDVLAHIDDEHAGLRLGD